MRISTITLFTLAITLVGCTLDADDQQDPQDPPHLRGCDRVQHLQMSAPYGAADVRVYGVTYEGNGSLATNMSYHVEQGDDPVEIPFCFGRGDVSFSLEVVPMGPSRLPSFENEVELRFGPFQDATLEISWSEMIQDTGPTVGVQSFTDDDQAEYIGVALRFPQL